MSASGLAITKVIPTQSDVSVLEAGSPKQCPLLAQSGHGLVRCTCLLLTQSGHWASPMAHKTPLAASVVFVAAKRAALH